MIVSETRGSSVLPPWPGRKVDAAGSRLHVRHAEPRAAGLASALFVHGLGGSARNWTDLMGELRDTVDGEALDLPGFGQSPPPEDGDYTLSGHATAVIQLIEARTRGPVHLFGNSLGGAVTIRVAALRPDLVRTLTLISPALPQLWPRPHSTAVGLYGVPGVGTVIRRWLTAQPVERRVQGMLDLVYADSSCVPEMRRRQAVEEYQRRDGLAYAQAAVVLSLRGLLLAYLDRGPSALWRQAALVRVPTLLVYGRRDKLVDARVARKAVATFPHARLVVLPHSGHVAMMEHPRIVARAFRDFTHGAAGHPVGPPVGPPGPLVGPPVGRPAGRSTGRGRPGGVS